jgi:nucleotide-binding universal stress UspA family protein
MTYKTLMVHLEIGRSAPGLLRIARDLADHFQAGVIGISGCQPMQLYYGDGYMTGDLVQMDRQRIDVDLKTAETVFRAAFGGCAGTVDWRSSVSFLPPSDYIARETRSADLLITEATRANAFSAVRSANTADLVMQVGRPVLVVPPGVEQLGLKRALVAWKDTREARRAVVDALPLLKASDHVTVVGVAASESLPHVRLHLDDVVRWLLSHGVSATSLASAFAGEDADRLHSLMTEDGAALIVAGAFGHNRLREWVLGGVTSDLLLRDDHCAFLSH